MSRALLRALVTAAAASLVLGLAGASAVTPSSYSSGDLTASIPNDSGLKRTSTINVPDAGQIADVNVSVRLDHPSDADLDLVLRAPDGTTIDLSSDNGGTGADYGSGATTCSGTFTAFDDEATVAVTSGTVPFNGSFQPESLLSVLDGKAPTGDWKLEITDDTTGAEANGTLYCWKLDITFAESDLVVTLTDAPDPVSTGSDLTYTVTVNNKGPSASTLTKLTQTLPAGATLVTSTTSQGTCTGAGPVVCDLGTLPVAATATLAFVVEPATGGTVVVTATASGGTTELVPADNAASATTTVNGEGGSETITVTSAGTGQGLVTSSPGGISCGYDCDGSYAPGTRVTLTATAAEGSTFDGWGSACPASTDDTCVLTAQGDLEVMATFTSDGSGGESGAGSGDGGSVKAGGTYYRCTITGTARANVLRGTPQRDVICGLGGDDRIYGLGGNDVLIGGAGRDVLYGGGGSDLLFAKDRWRDKAFGGPGRDRVQADVRDTLTGIEGAVAA